MAMLVLVIMTVLVAVVMLAAGVMAVRVRVAHGAQDARKTLLQHLNHSAPTAPGNPVAKA